MNIRRQSPINVVILARSDQRALCCGLMTVTGRLLLQNADPRLRASLVDTWFRRLLKAHSV